MSFVDIASPFAQLGIKVFPLPPRSKVPPTGFAFLERATTNPDSIAQWNRENPNFNVALLADDKFVFLEFDANGIKSAAKEMGVELPSTLITRMQKSGSGGSHFIFRHTDRSRAIGNRSVNLAEPCTCGERENRKCIERGCEETSLHHHHEWFSFRARNRYLVGAGSTHPNGNLYETKNDVDPVPVSDWICDFVEQHSAPAIECGKDETHPVSDEFDFDRLCEHYKISIAGIRDDVWYVVEECPGVGYRHEGSYLTGFYWDGNSLGWSCFAQGCPTHGKGIGGVLRLLNQTHAPYKGKIWEEDDYDLGGLLLDEEEQEDFQVIQPVADADALASIVNGPQSNPNPEGPQPEIKTKSGLKSLAAVTNDDVIFQLVTRSAADYEMEILEWIWPNKIPKGKMVLLTGPPDCGKTTCMVDIIARASNGADWPDGSKNENGPVKILLASSEDDPNDTLVPRLVAAGANLHNIEIVEGTYATTKGKKTKRKTLNLKRDAQLLIEAIQMHPEVQLLALDPIVSFFGDADANKDSDIRPIVDELKKTCQKSGLTLLGIVHSNKRSDVSAVHKVSGAGSLAGSARAVWGFSKDSEDKTVYHMSTVKGNLAEDKSGMDYRLESVTIQVKGKDVKHPRVVWGDKFEGDADDLLAASRDRKDKSDYKTTIAKTYLRSQKYPIKAKVLYERAQQDEGLNSNIIRKAKIALWDDGFHIIVKQQVDGWWWYHEQDGELVKDTSSNVESIDFEAI